MNNKPGQSRQATKFLESGAEVDSFYHLSHSSLEHCYCRGTSCFAAKHTSPERWEMALNQRPPVYCLGKCYASPSSTDTTEEPNIQILSSTGIVLAGVAEGTIRDFVSYRQADGYSALRRSLQMSSNEVVTQLEQSQLRGRGGAGFPAGRKFRSVLDQPGPVKYIVANADEGDHGSYIDRFIIERTPHRLLEAMAIAGHAVGAGSGYIYLRKEYPAAEASLRVAMQEAVQSGVLGEFTVELVIGKGSYVCGEETSLLNSIEHRRPEIRVRPPFPTEHGLFNCPTLVSNVETLVNLPWIITNGGEAYAQLGFSRSRGTKAISLNSLFNRAGLYEIEFGTSLREIVEEIGCGLKKDSIKALMMGGPIVGLAHPSEFDTRLGFEEMRDIGAAVGHGGIVAFDRNTNMLDLLAHLFEFGASESCGKCTPCRHGSRRAQILFRTAQTGTSLSTEGKAELSEILSTMRRTSLCGHGSGLAILAESIQKKFGEDVQSCFG